jgi:hypothetical protein
VRGGAVSWRWSKASLRREWLAQASTGEPEANAVQDDV